MICDGVVVLELFNMAMLTSLYEMHSQNHTSIPPRVFLKFSFTFLAPRNEPTQMEDLNSCPRNHKIWLKSCVVALSKVTHSHSHTLATQAID